MSPQKVVMPNNVDIEKAVLGMMILDNECAIEGMSKLKGEDFSDKRNRIIFETCCELERRGKPIDIMLVAEMIRMDEAFGESDYAIYLADVTSDIPLFSNVNHHIEILKDKTMLRQLITSSQNTIKEATSGEEMARDVIDRAEHRVLQIGEQYINKDFVGMGDLIDVSVNNLDSLRHGTALTGISTGFPMLDQLTTGLHGSEMVILAARPATGKTAMALNMAVTMAQTEGKHVGIFSMEMNENQLMQRMIHSVTGFTMQAVLGGLITERQWHELVATTNDMKMLPIYIDDSSALTPIEIRAKSRRLKHRHGLDIVFIDYLQLMHSERRTENRQQEVTRISSDLKAMAKDLNIVVVAVSQLSRRAVNHPGPPHLGDLRESGCLAGETLITRSDTGERVSIEGLAQRAVQVPIPIFALDEHHKIVSTTMEKAFYSGRKMVYELKTKSGRSIKASANHPFFKLGGWTALEELTIGDKIALPRVLSIGNSERSMSDDELILLAHLLGDGCVVPHQPVHYTNTDMVNVGVVSETANRLFGITPRLVAQENWLQLYLPSPYHLTHNRHNPIVQWLMDLGLGQKHSYDKFVPAKVFNQSNQAIALFLRHLWSTDGNISKKRCGTIRAASIYYSSSSPRLAYDVQHLLLRLGIISTVHVVPNKKGYRNMYFVPITGVQEQLSFLTQVGAIGARGAVGAEVAIALQSVDANPNNDVMPKEIWSTIIDPERKGRSWREVCSGIHTSYCGSTLFKSAPSRSRLNRIADTLGSIKLAELANSDIYWDEIIAINPIEEMDVYDATVPGLHNFIANDIVVHNSLEQDADLVLFLYDPQAETRAEGGRADFRRDVELRIAKQRNGPTGEIAMIFDASTTSFTERDANGGAYIGSPYVD